MIDDFQPPFADLRKRSDDGFNKAFACHAFTSTEFHNAITRAEKFVKTGFVTR